MSHLDIELDINFGLCDLVMQQMTFDSQDFLRLLIDRLGSMNNTPVNIRNVVNGLTLAINSFSREGADANDDLKDFKKKVDWTSPNIVDVY